MEKKNEVAAERCAESPKANVASVQGAESLGGGVAPAQGMKPPEGDATSAQGAESPKALVLCSGGVDSTTLLAMAVERLRSNMARLFSHTDPDIQVSLREVPPPERVWNRGSRDSTLDLAALLYNGVFAMHDTMPGQVSASSSSSAKASQRPTSSRRSRGSTAARF